MKVQVLLTDESGRVFAGEAVLALVPQGEVTSREMRAAKSGLPRFELGERAFAKIYGNGRSGPEIFTLLVAYVAKGDRSNEVKVQEVEKLWGRMTSILGMGYNGKYPTVAKEYGWTDSPQRGVYVLTPDWVRCIEIQSVA
jgi:hypothetical protein